MTAQIDSIQLYLCKNGEKRNAKEAMSTRITITLSDFALRKLTCWAALHDRTRAGYAGQILESRIEANAQLIQELMEDEAKYRGITIEELESEFLKKKEDD